MEDLVDIPFSFLKPGMVLHASCSDEDYGTIVAVNPASKHMSVPSVDVEINDLGDILEHADCWEEGFKDWVELPGDKYQTPKWQYSWAPGTKIVVRGVPVLRITKYPVMHPHDLQLGLSPYNIELDTPGDGCYRCTRYFSIRNYAA